MNYARVHAQPRRRGVSLARPASKTVGGLLLAAMAATCTTDDRTSDIPAQSAAPVAAVYAQAADSGRVLARGHIATRYLPGITVAVGRNGEVVWAEGFGWADLSHGTLATPETLYPVGSISKPMTTTAVGLLHERGKLDLDVPIQTYVPSFPEKRWPITTRQLLGHVAGVHNYGAADALRQDPCSSAVDGLDVISEDTLLFEPEHEFRYSNYGFRLVGAVVEAASGEPLTEFMRREVFAPMGLERTTPDLGGDMEIDRATFYTPGSFRTLRRSQELDMSCSMAAGGFLSTPSELVRFGFAMLDAELLRQETVDMLWTSQRLVDGEPTGYGMGWSVGTTQLGDDAGRTPSISHGGAVLGGRASLLIFPEENMVVATMTNSRGDPGPLARELAALFRDSALN